MCTVLGHPAHHAAPRNPDRLGCTLCEPSSVNGRGQRPTQTAADAGRCGPAPPTGHAESASFLCSEERRALGSGQLRPVPRQPPDVSSYGKSPSNPATDLPRPLGQSLNPGPVGPEGTRSRPCTPVPAPGTEDASLHVGSINQSINQASKQASKQPTYLVTYLAKRALGSARG